MPARTSLPRSGGLRKLGPGRATASPGPESIRHSVLHLSACNRHAAPSSDCICLPLELAASALPGIADQRVNVDIFDGLNVGFVLSVRSSAHGGLPTVL